MRLMRIAPSPLAARYFTTVALAAVTSVSFYSGCGGSGGNSTFGGNSSGGDGGNSSSGNSGSGSGGSLTGSSSGSASSGGSSGGMAVCPSGLQCNVSCSGGGTTSISGIVYDPAGKDPLYDITVYVPATPLQALPPGVPTGEDACSCGALYKSGAVVSTTTGVDGSFKLDNAPVGSSVPLVIQVGKWRRQFNIAVSSCKDNPQPGTMLSLPATVSMPNDSMPNIAVSTGGADTLECLMHRIGLPTTEYVAGAGGTGHVHVFSGGKNGGGGGGMVGQPEQPSMTGAPPSNTSLWASQADLMPYDIVLLSCEGGETYDANPPALEAYLNAGGRAFGSHFHYAWFSGPLDSGQAYTAPADWGTNLATWTAGSNGSGNQANGKIVQTLNTNASKPFPKGVALYQWLGLNDALGVLNAPAMELPMRPPRFNAVVGPTNTPSQPWVQDDMTPNTMYFSFDTPVNAMPAADGGPPAYCGRAVFSDLHVGGETMPADQPPPPDGCTTADLSPQEKALEFMLFDLSSCVIPDDEAPSDAGVPIITQ
jgi:hypothetical protein